MLQDSRSFHVQGKALTSSDEDLPPPAAPLPTADESPNVLAPFQVGADLRTARERLGWSLAAVATHLHIRRSLLEAIENGQFEELLAPAYTLGHVRAYADALGLHSDEVARRFRAEAAARFHKPRLEFPVPLPERGLPAGAVVLLGLVLAVGAYAGWWRMSANSVSDEPVRQVPQHLAELVQPPPPPPPSAAVTAPRPQAEATTPAPNMPSLPPTSAAAAIPASGVYGPPLAGTVVPPGAGLPPLPEGTRIVLRAHADTWLQIRDRQGRVLLNRVLRSGETWPVPAGKAPGQLLMTTGNAGGTDVLVDGQATQPLGNDGVVRRNMPLDADAILGGSLAAPAVAARAAKPTTANN